MPETLFPRPTLASTVVALFLATAIGCRESTDTQQSKNTQQPADAARFVDHHDGTVTDLTTGLMWEKKSHCRGKLHDYTRAYPWSGDGARETIWDWIDQLNGDNGHGFAGYSDWRIPNVIELLSLVDYGRVDPAVDALLENADCSADCGDPSPRETACTASAPYWTSTTFADFPAHAFAVSFADGSTDDRLKTRSFFVRAVRGRVGRADPGGNSSSQ